MRQQIANRLGVAHVRDTVKQFVAGSVTREQAMEDLQIERTRLYELKASYLAAVRLVQGTFLNLDGDESRVEFRVVGGAQTAAVEEFTSAGPDVLTFPSPAGLVAGKAYEVTVERIDPNGVTRTRSGPPAL